MDTQDATDDVLNADGYTILRPGEEREPVVVIDDFSPRADELKQAGQAASYGGAGRHYPGQRTGAPAAYLGERMDLLQTVLTDVFGMGQGAALVECNYSIVTTRPQDLTPIQRLPHFDSTDPGYLALLHYLCGPEEGGTSFYRHVATGFETISEPRLKVYTETLQGEVQSRGIPPAEYFSGSTEQFERIGGVDAVFNRMVIYRGYRLHSGDILRPAQIGAPGATPRLTVNTFLKARAT